MQELRLTILGNPAPQGSKKIIHGRLIEASGQKLKVWRKAIADTCATSDGWFPSLGPIQVEVTFHMPRPKTVSPEKRPNPTVAPDLDKLLRALLDGIGQSGVIWGDDAQVVEIRATKEYAEAGQPTGANVVIREI